MSLSLSGGSRATKGRTSRGSVELISPRELEVLTFVYQVRAATTAQIALGVWGGDLTSGVRKVIRGLTQRGLLESARVRVPGVRTWAEPTSTAGLSGWSVVVTERGIQALVQAGVLAEFGSEEGRKYQRAAKRRPKPQSLAHTLLVTGAKVECARGSTGVVWSDRFEERVFRTGTRRHVTDAVMVAGEERWAVEVDRGVLHVPDLLDRWAQLLGANDPDSEVPEGWPDGYLWLMTARTADLLRGRVSRLRRALAERMEKLPWLDQVRWVVDSYDGALWTWRHWFRPWALGEQASPGEEMAWAVVDHLGELPMPLVVTLADLQMWVRLIRMAEEGLRRVIVVVRDELEAEDLQHVLERRAPMTAALYLIAGRDARSTEMTGLVRYPGDTGWRSVPLKSYAG